MSNTLFKKIENITGKEKISIQIEEKISSEAPLIQIADLFAGFICFSRTNYEKYHQQGLDFYKWRDLTKQYNLSRNSLFVDDFSLTLYENIKAIENTISNNDIKRYFAKQYFINKFKEQKLGLSINTNGYISADTGKQGFYILHYQPQNTYDKGPIE